MHDASPSIAESPAIAWLPRWSLLEGDLFFHFSRVVAYGLWLWERERTIP